MTLPSSGNSISLGQIANEFGYTQGSATRTGDYRTLASGSNYPQSIGALSFSSIDAQSGGSVPTSGQIKFSDFYGTQLQQVVNFWSSGAGGFRLVARNRYETNGMIGGNNEVKNIDIVNHICSILDRLKPRHNKNSYKDLITYVEDRPGHDFRYAIDASKITKDLKWKPEESFSSGIKKTVCWYLDNSRWWEKILKRNSK